MIEVRRLLLIGRLDEAERFMPSAKGVRESHSWYALQGAAARLDVLAALGKDDPLLTLAIELERIALEDEYFVERQLYPNVDFYSGIIFRALGLPPAMFTPVFAVARTVGWVAHWNEMMTDPETRIVRPRQLYAGPTERPFVPVENRAEQQPLVG